MGQEVWGAVQSLQSLILQQDPEVPKDTLFLMPTILAVEGLGMSAAEELLLEQYRLLKNADTRARENAIIRVPHTVGPDRFDEIVQHFKNVGVTKAAFIFDGTLGPRDLANVMLRSKIPPNWVTIALGRIEVSMIPVLFYLGFDIFDIGRAHEAASHRIRLWRDGEEPVDPTGTHRYCACTSCGNIDDFGKLTHAEFTQVLLQHNIKKMCEMLSESQEAMQSGRLRWLVESITHVSPAMASFVRQINKTLYNYLEEFTPTMGHGEVSLIGPESYHAPVVKRFRDRVATQYQPPSHKRVVLLLPCSARKPYSDSRSHRRFIATIEEAIGRGRAALQEIIVTSPLGIVPRELERVFPAANYNIPVTGDWDAEEVAIAADALIAVMKKFEPDVPIIAHVSGGYCDVVRKAEATLAQSIIYTTPESSATSRDSLKSLQEVLTDLRKMGYFENQQPTVIQDTLRAVADFQFGPGAGDLLVPQKARFRGKLYKMVMCFDNKMQTCSFLGEAGNLTLTIDGGERIKQLNRYWVRFTGDEIRGSSIFAMGVDEADDSIRPGDEVIITDRNDQVVAVGRSEMSGREMRSLDRGIAVTLRHKRREK